MRSRDHLAQDSKTSAARTASPSLAIDSAQVAYSDTADVFKHAAWRDAKARALAAIACGGIVAIVGMPGVGKSSLLADIEQDLLSSEWRGP